MLFGKRGNGKSAVMAKLLLDERKQNRPVWYWPEDYGFKYGKAIDIKDLYSLPDWLHDGTVGIDEIQVLLNKARTISTANLLGGTMLQQLRKRNLNIIGTSNQPRKIDGTVELQTDWHAFCKRIIDPRCEATAKRTKQGKRFHLKDCQDGVVLRMVDTNGNQGVDPRYKDGRKRKLAYCADIREGWAIYNTKAIADAMESVSMTKDSIMDWHESRKSGTTLEELTDKLTEVWIPWLADQGHRSLAVAQFTRYINENYGLKIGSRRMGAALASIGMKSKKTASANVVTLPKPEEIDAFQMGVWTSDPE